MPTPELGPVVPGPRPPDVRTDYANGRINVQTNAPGYSGGGAGNQLLALLGPLLDWKMAQAEKRAAPGGARVTPMPVAPGPREGARRQPTGGGGGGRTPMFTKMVGGPQMVAGRVSAQPWEAGAAFSGYAPPGFNPYPNNATFAGPQGAELTAPGISAPAARTQAAAFDPFPHGTGQAFAQQQMAAAKARSDQEIAEREARRAAGSRE
jgi:hypothetical protein